MARAIIINRSAGERVSSLRGYTQITGVILRLLSHAFTLEVVCELVREVTGKEHGVDVHTKINFLANPYRSTPFRPLSLHVPLQTV